MMIEIEFFFSSEEKDGHRCPALVMVLISLVLAPLVLINPAFILERHQATYLASHYLGEESNNQESTRKDTHIIPISLDGLRQHIGPGIDDRGLKRGLCDGWDRHIGTSEHSNNAT